MSCFSVHFSFKLRGETSLDCSSIITSDVHDSSETTFGFVFLNVTWCSFYFCSDCSMRGVSSFGLDNFNLILFFRRSDCVKWRTPVSLFIRQSSAASRVCVCVYRLLCLVCSFFLFSPSLPKRNGGEGGLTIKVLGSIICNSLLLPPL